MTTLILDRTTKTLYADQKETYAKGALAVKCKKIEPVHLKGKQWGWIALCGDSAEGYTFLHYLKGLTDISELNVPDEKRPNWKKLGGFLVGIDGSTYNLSEEGVPMPITETLMAEGAGYVPAKLLLEAGVPIPKIFWLMGKYTGHTSQEYDSVQYGKKQTKIIYDQIHTDR